jgi:hypothetical protein
MHIHIRGVTFNGNLVSLEACYTHTHTHIHTFDGGLVAVDACVLQDLLPVLEVVGPSVCVCVCVCVYVCVYVCV